MPTVAHRKGAPKLRNPPISEHTGLWLLDCGRTDDTADNQIQKLLVSLPQSADVWLPLSQKYSAGIKVHLYLARWCRETLLSSETISILAERGLKLSIDIYSKRPDAG
jgi:hypothetical protein